MLHKAWCWAMLWIGAQDSTHNAAKVDRHTGWACLPGGQSHWLCLQIWTKLSKVGNTPVEKAALSQAYARLALRHSLWPHLVTSSFLHPSSVRCPTSRDADKPCMEPCFTHLPQCGFATATWPHDDDTNALLACQVQLQHAFNLLLCESEAHVGSSCIQGGLQLRVCCIRHHCTCKTHTQPHHMRVYVHWTHVRTLCCAVYRPTACHSDGPHLPQVC